MVENDSICTAGIIIIGDEILRGHTKDTNSRYLLKKLWSLGVKVGKVSVISDEVDEIAHEVRQFSSRYTVVITTGGIGPTHDDVTLNGIAKAFGEDLVLNDKLVELISNCYQDEINSSHLKMARVPSSGKLAFGKDPSGKPSCFPLISVHNVYVFPGVPQYLEKSFGLLEDILIISNCKRRFLLQKIYLSVDETAIASILDEVDEKFKGKVHFGSYPDICNQHFKVKLTVESDSSGDLQEAWDYLLERLPKEFVVKTEVDRHDCDASVSECPPSPTSPNEDSEQVVNVEKVYHLLNPKDESNTSACLKGAWAIIEQTLQLYSLDELCISFNGGKDCTVLLHILHAVLNKLSLPVKQLKALYFRNESPFPQAEEFISETTKRYNLNLIKLTENIKMNLRTLKETHPKIKAIFLGTRRHDPFSDTLHAFSPTDPDWPHYMRVNPILDWHHADVWAVIQECNIPYCSLYDEGYTSLGSTHDTKPNPALKCKDGSDKYKPAHMLEDGNLERAGRN